jgi:hypothetical protein
MPSVFPSPPDRSFFADSVYDGLLVDKGFSQARNCVQLAADEAELDCSITSQEAAIAAIS